MIMFDSLKVLSKEKKKYKAKWFSHVWFVFNLKKNTIKN